MVKKRIPPRKSSPKKRVKKAARPVRKSASTARRKGGVDFRPVKRDLKAHIAKLEKQLGGQARAAAVDQAPWDTLDKLHQLDRLMTDVCTPNMVIGS